MFRKRFWISVNLYLFLTCNFVCNKMTEFSPFFSPRLNWKWTYWEPTGKNNNKPTEEQCVEREREGEKGGKEAEKREKHAAANSSWCSLGSMSCDRDVTVWQPSPGTHSAAKSDCQNLSCKEWRNLLGKANSIAELVNFSRDTLRENCA